MTTARQTTTIMALEEALAVKGEDHPFLDFLGDTLTLGALDRRSDALALHLAALGARRGECVTSLLDNGLDQVMLMFAVFKLGAVHVPLNTAYKGDYLSHQINDSRATILVTERDYADRVVAIEADLAFARTLLVRTAAGGALPGTARLEVLPLDTMLSPPAAKPAWQVEPGDLAMLIYTAGTTGPSKGCMISQNYVCNLGRLIGDMYEVTDADILWSPLPGFHFNLIANLLTALQAGARMAIYPRFSVSNFWKEVVRTGATITTLLGSMVALIAEADDDEWTAKAYGQIRVAGGIPFPPPVQEKWRGRFGVRHIGDSLYGLTECTNVSHAAASATRPATTCGRENDSYEVRIVDEAGRDQPRGVAGEIVMRPKLPNVMFQGYWNQPEATLRQIRNLWFHSGDIGRIDEDGWLFFVDRKKDYLRRRGENVSTIEMEAVFRKHPDVADVAVHAVPSALTEDDIKVTLIRTPGSTLTEEALCRWSVDQLPYFAVPRYVEFRDDLPRNPVGRVLKYELREQGVTAATWDRERSSLEMTRR